MQFTETQKDALYQDYHEKVLHMIYSKVCDRTLAEDLTEDVFVKVYSKLDSFDDTKASVSTWIYRIAQNTVIDYYRVRKINSEVPEDLTQEGEIDDELLNDEMMESLANALEQLPERDRNLIILHYYKNMTLKDAAAAVGMSYSNAKLVHNKSIVMLKRYMDIED